MGSRTVTDNVGIENKKLEVKKKETLALKYLLIDRQKKCIKM